MATPSHRLKLRRAAVHLTELDDLLLGFRNRRPYPVVESQERVGKRQEYVYRLDLSEAEIPEDFPIILGELLFNVRSALDHLMVSIAPNKRKGSTEFRICTTDPLAKDASGAYVNEEQAQRWLSCLKSFPDGYEEAFRSLQPFEQSTKYGQRAEDHALAVLSALQNADKHRWMLTAMSGLEKVQITINGNTLGLVPGVPDGYKFTRGPNKLSVGVEGQAVVGIASKGGQFREFGVLIKHLTKFVANEVLPTLEPFL